MVIAAITSCTNTSNPSVMLGAGLLARKAVARGLKVKPYVKTSLAPGSKVVTEYLEKSGLMPRPRGPRLPPGRLRLHHLHRQQRPAARRGRTRAVNEGKLVAAAVLSGNRNFEGRINPDVKANYLASPPLVVAYALAGTTDIDLATEPLGVDGQGKPVPARGDLAEPSRRSRALEATIGADMFRKTYANVFDGNPTWNAIAGVGGRPLRTSGRTPPTSRTRRSSRG